MTTRFRLALAAGLAVCGLAGWAAASLWSAPARQAEVYKSMTCGCCTGWVEYLQDQGWKVTIHDVDDVDAVKDRLNVPEEARSCHTAIIDGYVVEGHVPVEAIDKLLAERPKWRGIASPGMPSGSPGMSGPKEPNVIVSFGPHPPQIIATY